MPSPIVSSTIQSAVLAASSCIIGQLITAHKSDELKSFALDTTQIFQFALFSLLSSPPNFLWQSYLETTFPSTHLVPTTAALRAASSPQSSSLDKEQKAHPLTEPALSIPNTIFKFLLDQTLGAAFNTLAFILVFAGFRGANVEQAVVIARQDFWGLMKAGWKLWPAVSMLNFTVVRSVTARQLVGNLAGMGWNVYLSLVTGGG